jgi:hypothetical protein
LTYPATLATTGMVEVSAAASSPLSALAAAAAAAASSSYSHARHQGGRPHNPPYSIVAPTYHVSGNESRHSSGCEGGALSPPPQSIHTVGICQICQANSRDPRSSYCSQHYASPGGEPEDLSRKCRAVGCPLPRVEIGNKLRATCNEHLSTSGPFEAWPTLEKVKLCLVCTRCVGIACACGCGFLNMVYYLS